MLLDDIAMIAADTSRTAVYLEALVREGLIPGHAMVMQNTGSELLPGQQSTSANQEDMHGLNRLFADAEMSVERLASTDINSAEVVEAVGHRKESIIIYSGFGGAILRKGILGTGKRFLHIHGGYLPQFRGSTTNYYSLIQENTCGASAIFLTEDLDGGPILLRRKFPAPSDRLSIDHGFDSAIRAEVLVDVLRHFVDNGEWPQLTLDHEPDDMFYIIHPVLKHIAILATPEPGIGVLKS